VSGLALCGYLEIAHSNPQPYRQIDWTDPGLCVPNHRSNPMRYCGASSFRDPICCVGLAADYPVPFLTIVPKQKRVQRALLFVINKIVCNFHLDYNLSSEHENPFLHP